MIDMYKCLNRKKRIRYDVTLFRRTQFFSDGQKTAVTVQVKAPKYIIRIPLRLVNATVTTCFTSLIVARHIKCPTNCFCFTDRSDLAGTIGWRRGKRPRGRIGGGLGPGVEDGRWQVTGMQYRPVELVYAAAEYRSNVVRSSEMRTRTPASFLWTKLPAGNPASKMTYNICVSKLIVSASATSLTLNRDRLGCETIWSDPRLSGVNAYMSPGARNCDVILYRCLQMAFVNLFAVNWTENGTSRCSTVVKILTRLSTHVGSSSIYEFLSIQH